jgi:hypothetical protein
MKAIIVIECDEDNEVLKHLSVIRKQLKAAILKRRKEQDNLNDLVVVDDNCYGSHMATVHYENVDTSQIVVANYTN